MTTTHAALVQTDWAYQDDYDFIHPRTAEAITSTRTIYRDIYFLVQPHLPYLGQLKRGVDVLLGLAGFIYVYHESIPRWLWDSVRPRDQIFSILRQTAKEVLSDLGPWLGNRARVAYKFLTIPWYSPEERARLARLQKVAPQRLGFLAARTLPEFVHPGKTPEGMVRVKWYPSAEAPYNWPSGMGDLWEDIPIESDGSLDLRPLKQKWGLENCFHMLAGPGKRVRVGRRPDEKLSQLAWNVALEGNSVLGIIERPSRVMVDARKWRARFKREAPYAPFHLLDLVLWIAITFLAIVTFALWRAIMIALHHAAQQLIVLVRFFGPLMRMCYEELRYCARKAAYHASSLPGLVWMAGTEWVAFLGRGLLAWTVALLEVFFLDRDEVMRAERAARGLHPSDGVAGE